jgi:hypothetical protein
MLWSRSTAAFLGLAVSVAYLFYRRARAYTRLSHIRGPFWAGWTDMWMIRSQLSGRMNFILQDANTKYGMSQPRAMHAFPV